MLLGSTVGYPSDSLASCHTCYGEEPIIAYQLEPLY